MNKPARKWGACLALALILGVAACQRQADKQPAPKGTSSSSLPAVVTPAAAAPATPVAGSDRTFVAQAAASGLGEVEAGRYMAGKTSDARIKAFAQQLERDHTSANDELKRIAGGKGITLPSTPEGDAKAQIDRLKSLPQSGLDREFVQMFGVDAHNQAIQLFEREAREGQDPELKAFAERTLPKLREHLGMAQQLQGKKAGAG